MSFYRDHAGAASPEWRKRDLSQSPPVRVSGEVTDPQEPDRKTPNENPLDLGSPSRGRGASRASSVILNDAGVCVPTPTPRPSPPGSRTPSVTRYRSPSPNGMQQKMPRDSSSSSESSHEDTRPNRKGREDSQRRADSPYPGHERLDPVSYRSPTESSFRERNKLILRTVEEAMNGAKNIRLEIHGDYWKIGTFNSGGRRGSRDSQPPGLQVIVSRLVVNLGQNPAKHAETLEAAQ